MPVQMVVVAYPGHFSGKALWRAGGHGENCFGKIVGGTTVMECDHGCAAGHYLKICERYFGRNDDERQHHRTGFHEKAFQLCRREPLKIYGQTRFVGQALQSITRRASELAFKK